DALTQPQFSHLRLNVRDLTASVDWYGRIGLRPQAPPRRCEVAPKALGLAAKAALTVASLTTEADPSLSFELTAWDRPAVCGEPITPANHLGIYRIALGVDDVHAACAHLRRGDPEVPDPIWVDLPGTKLGGVCVLFLRDPDGITVELVQRPRAAMTGRS
ncbi:MAG: lactoylglutathione lyase, partial [Mycobacterium sp.]|nr:lactoylglutathione lyase [Mycobacterium sp.]